MARIIQVEGPKGCGKSTFIKDFRLVLENAGYVVYDFCEPGGTSEMSKALRTLLKDGPERSAECEALLMQAARLELWKKDIEPIVKKEDSTEIVLVDRSIFSSLVYQFHMKNVDTVPAMHRLTNDGYSADLCIWLLPELDIIKERLAKRSGNEDAINKDSSNIEMQYLAYKEIYTSMSSYCEEIFSKSHIMLDGIDSKDNARKALNTVNSLEEFIVDSEVKARLHRFAV